MGKPIGFGDWEVRRKCEMFGIPVYGLRSPPPLRKFFACLLLRSGALQDSFSWGGPVVREEDRCVTTSRSLAYDYVVGLDQSDNQAPFTRLRSH